MTTNYWLYADPDDGQSIKIIDVIKTQFPQAVLCKDFDQLIINLRNQQQHVVILIQPTDNEKINNQLWNQQLQTLVALPIQCVWLVNELFTLYSNIMSDTLVKIIDWSATIPNLLIVAPGQHNFGTNHYPWVNWQHWLQDAVNVYKKSNMQNYISTFDPKKQKSQLFDVLLGGERIYRTLLHDWIEQDPILSPMTIMAYYGGYTTRPRLIYEPEMVIKDPITHTVILCQFRDIITRFSIIPPVSVYQQTAYSIVTETNAQHNFVFFTEKIARVMACRRLFIVFSSYRYLHYLRESGFKTFGHIINESYDSEVDDVRRWRMAFEQMKQLATMNQGCVLEQIQPIVEHNLQVLMTTDWNKKMSHDVGQILAARLNFEKT